LTHAFPVDDASRVAEVRRATAALAQAEGLDEILAANAALVATEICTNLLKHAKQGEVLLSPLSDRAEPGIEILAIDRGPGMTDIAGCLVDGFSTASSSGTGLGAIARLSQEFDIHSDQPRGTVLVARIRRPECVRTKISGVVKPMIGEDLCGDSWDFYERDGVISIIVADGLGHGVMAARASAEAIAAFRRSDGDLPKAILERVHGSLRSTRGAAVAVAHIDRALATVSYAGVGNVAGQLVGGVKPQILVSHNGTAGYHSPRLQEFSYVLPEVALLVMHSDGLHSRWNLDDYPGLRRRHPSIVAGVLYRDAARHRDDACVVVAKIAGDDSRGGSS
jgi:anti-sigma regulatory factor (Ser/Thr protein kinase)